MQSFLVTKYYVDMMNLKYGCFVYVHSHRRQDRGVRVLHEARESHSLAGQMMDHWWEHSSESAIADV